MTEPEVELVWQHWACGLQHGLRYTGKSKYDKIYKQTENGKVSYAAHLWGGGVQYFKTLKEALEYGECT